MNGGRGKEIAVSSQDIKGVTLRESAQREDLPGSQHQKGRQRVTESENYTGIKGPRARNASR